MSLDNCWNLIRKIKTCCSSFSMCLLVFFCFWFGCRADANGQALRDINYSYEYNPQEAFAFRMKPVRGSEWNVYYQLELRDTSAAPLSAYFIQWEARETIADKQNITTGQIKMSERARSKVGIDGVVRIPVDGAPKILVAKVVNNVLRRGWLFYRTLEENYPITFNAFVGQRPLLAPFVNLGDSVKLDGQVRVLSYYNDDFPPALPPFSESQGRVSKAIKADSTISVQNPRLLPERKGLYLAQSDTLSTSAIVFRVEDDYPKLTKVPSLAGPLIYISTKQENDRLVLAKNDKKAFDRVILNITQDTERAKKLIRNYFRRVDAANQLFTSYKEGWKTDRGMIYIIFGPPEEVYKFNDREVWTYKTAFDVTFNFAKSPSIFDADNYVLIRNKKYQQLWYEVVDLWRNGRF